MAYIEEIEHLRALELVGDDWWKGVRSFLTYTPNAPAYMQAFRNQAFPNVPGRNAPRVRRTRALFNPEGRRGRAMLLSWYETLRTPKRARILVRTADRPQKMLLDTEGRTIEGPDQHSAKGGKPDGIHAWQLISGEATDLRPYGVLRVETAYYARRFRYADVMPLIGATNHQRLPNLGNAARGTMRLVRVGSDWQWGDDLIYLNYDLQWSGPDETWNDTVKSRKGLWITVKDNRFWLNPETGEIDPLDGTLHKEIFVPGKERYTTKDASGNTIYKIRDSTDEPRTPFREKDFSALRSLKVW